jgi:hypothetical protein
MKQLVNLRLARRPRRAAAVVLTCVALVVLPGCVALPESGPVVESESEGSLDEPPVIFIDPKPPEPGEQPDEIVNDFLEAMTATPLSTDVARQYLTRDAGAVWEPEAETIIFAERSDPRGTDTMTVGLTGANRLDERGSFRGPLPPDEQTLTFPMALEDGEWRIAAAPNALIVPESWFEQRFRQVSLYFLDPSARILVPEPVFVQRGQSSTTALTEALLRGPGPELEGVSRTFIPSGLDFDLSVPVSEDGVADLNLRGYSGQLTPEASELMLTQLAWTLRQEPEVDAIRVSIGGQQVTSDTGQSVFDVDERSEYDPTGLDSSHLSYALDDGRLVSGQPETLSPVEGPMGTQSLGVRSYAVNLDGTVAAAITSGGDAVLTSSVSGPSQRVQQVVSGAENLLRPGWDFADRLWLVDARRDGAVVFLVGSKGGPTEVDVQGVSGRRVTRLIVSRDGSRLVAVVRGRTGDRIMVSRVLRNVKGRVVGATPARRIGWAGDGSLQIRDIAWTTTTSIAVLHRIASQLSEVRTISVDGSPSGADDLLTQLSGPVRSLAGSPVPGESLYAVTGAVLADLSRGDAGDVAIDPSIQYLDYVG